MHLRKARILMGSLLLAALWASQAGAKTRCDLPELAHQKKDAATIRRLENLWSEAFLTGNTKIMSCLLDPNYTEISRSGELQYFAEEIGMASRNRDKNLMMPQLPDPNVELHENVATAHGQGMATTTSDGKQVANSYADFFVWKNGRWQAFFSVKIPVHSH
ncbi:MAG TPA: nuclear transport factor 2 family protein [Candidatus Acidoferrales bacterium]|nr:nuclear transport factor 2 family protein [Candidatus Acidoferrales bacterium]